MNTRALDVLVVRKILGKEIKYIKVLEGLEWPSGEAHIAHYPVIVTHDTSAYADVDGTVKLDVVPSYCHDLTATLEIIEKLVTEQMLKFELEMTSIDPYSFKVKFGNAEATAETIPLAIVKAALKWAGKEVGSNEE